MSRDESLPNDLEPLPKHVLSSAACEPEDKRGREGWSARRCLAHRVSTHLVPTIPVQSLMSSCCGCAGPEWSCSDTKRLEYPAISYDTKPADPPVSW